jgi:hypothetical protein
MPGTVVNSTSALTANMKKKEGWDCQQGNFRVNVPVC